MAKELQIIVDDGRRRVPIRNKDGDEVGEFYFSPTDTNIIMRYNEIASKFDEVTKPLEDVDIKPDGEGGDEAAAKALSEAQTRLYKLLDYMFGGEMSEAFFGKISPFSPINGRFYCETALEALGDFIGAQFNEETKKVNSRIGKYTNKYKK